MEEPGPLVAVVVFVLRMAPYSTGLVCNSALLFLTVLVVVSVLMADGCGGGGTSGGHVGTLAK